ncbi:MAG: hypothetical protein ACR65U_01430 [Methylocystis sp.]|jgi:hypothetical protein
MRAWREVHDVGNASPFQFPATPFEGFPPMEQARARGLLAEKIDEIQGAGPTNIQLAVLSFEWRKGVDIVQHARCVSLPLDKQQRRAKPELNPSGRGAIAESLENKPVP